MKKQFLVKKPREKFMLEEIKETKELFKLRTREKMWLLTEVVEMLSEVVAKLDVLAEKERQQGNDFCRELEEISWESYKMSNQIHKIQKAHGE